MFQRPHIRELIRKANGIGIVCGLEVIVSGDCTLTITSGYGFTSTGEFLHFPGGHFKYYRPYPHDIKGLLEEEDGYPAWELLEKIEGHPDCTPLTPQTIEAQRFIDEKVVLLYKEQAYHEHIKPILINKEDLWEILNQSLRLDLECLPLDGLAPDDLDLFDGGEEFPNGRQLFCAINRNTSVSPIYLMRFGFATDESECNPEDREFKLTSATFEGIFKEYELIILDALAKLKTGLQQLHESVFHDLFPAQQRHYLERYFEYLKGNRWISFKTTERKQFIQYFHDLIRDLVTTFNELVHELCKLMADCCPDENLFPCHLLLGEIEEDIAFGPSIFRHHFRQPPIYNDNRLRYQRIRFLHWRMVMQIKNFYIPFVESVDFADDHYAQIDKDDTVPEIIGTNETLENIRVTPSRERQLPLGQQAIPFYYYVGEDANSMHHFWDFESVFCCKKQHQLSYHAEEDDSHTNLCAIKRPLAYNEFPHAFFRVEGAIGQTFEVDDPSLIDTPFDHIQDLLQRFNLGFKVRAISVQEFLIDYPFPDGDGDFQINNRFLGAEHIAGAQLGGYYLLIWQEFEIGIKTIIADFWVPYCCLGEEVSQDQGDDGDGNDASIKIKGQLYDPCKEEGVKTTITIGGTNIESDDTGLFSMELEPGNHPLALSSTSYYLQKNTLTIPFSTTDHDLGEIQILPKKNLLVQLRNADEKLGVFQHTVQLYANDGLIAQRSPIGSNPTVSFIDLEHGTYTIRWIEAQKTEIKELKICDRVETITMTFTDTGRTIFPPELDDRQWPEWEGLPPKQVQEIIDKFRGIWSRRVKDTLDFLGNISEVDQRAVVPQLDPIVADFELSTASLNQHYDQLMKLVGVNSRGPARSAWSEFGKNTTEMYLERLSLNSKEVDRELDSRIAKLPDLGVIESGSLNVFIENWLDKVSGFINPEYEKEFRSKLALLTPIDVPVERIELSHPLDSTNIHGMGKKTEEWLRSQGVKTMEDLVKIQVKDLQQLLQTADSPQLRRQDSSSWPKQAKLILDGQGEQLKALKKKLKNKPK